jgi:hypothetical protein
VHSIGVIRREHTLDSFVLIASQSAQKNLRVALYPALSTSPVLSAANLSFVARQYGDDDIFVRGKARWGESSSPPATQDGLSLLYLSPEQLVSTHAALPPLTTALLAA